MALLINQGKQDTSQDNKFNPIVEKDVLGQITELKLSKNLASTIEVTFRLLNGAHKGRFVFDRVSYDSKSDFSWKYRALRKAAHAPYDENEPAQIDIEALLLNKAVLMDLSVRKGKDKNGDEQEYQNITYKVSKLPDTVKKDGDPIELTAPPIEDITEDPRIIEETLAQKTTSQPAASESSVNLAEDEPEWE